MNILHICLTGFYTDNFNYQENILSRINKKDGHNVKIIATIESLNNGIGEYMQSGRYYTTEGIEVVRVPYCKWLPVLFARKLRFYERTYYEIEIFKPNIIFLHGLQMGEMGEIIKYKKKHPKTIIYADSHSDKYNSARGIVSRRFLHQFYYKRIAQRALPYIEKIFYITIEAKDFLIQMYQIPEQKLEFYPLGGIVFDKDEISKNKKNIREKLKISKENIIFLHAGKMNQSKKTKELVKAFHRLEYMNCCLLIIGKFEENYRKEILPIIAHDSRINYLGWKSGEELLTYLCASDIYVQPGTQSVTMQNALCCNCAVIIADYPSHRYLLGENAIYASTENDLYNKMKYLLDHPKVIKEKQLSCYKLAKKQLDYSMLAKRIYQDFKE